MTEKYINRYTLAIVLEGNWGPDNRVWLNGKGDIVDSPIDYNGDDYNDCWEGFDDVRSYYNAIRKLMQIANSHNCNATLVRYVDNEVEHYDEDGDYTGSEYLGLNVYYIHTTQPTQEEEE